MMDNQQVFVVTAGTQGEANEQARQWVLGRSPEFLAAHAGQELEVVPAS
jgi:hypothetical protein